MNTETAPQVEMVSEHLAVLERQLQAAESQLAELEKHSERIEVAYLASESRAEDAETQLAELRGRLEERCVMLDGLAGVIRQYGLCAPMALEEVAKQIRTLAAADGGGK